ncbi:uncharacterized protein LOC132742707 [Ruditapes philippinarum]|uniref:uncharacterized protein LOC132742707 n=1 Tax=Ruditapes philippinarum TaxID=129788 RepID=UPI00295B4D0D|nr:uncharacterized protein LOC132742707 [Ruditapes philippinarum]
MMRQERGGHFRFINILAELDQPGEYYLDRVSGKLYMWAPNHDGNIHSSDVLYISMINNCFEIYPPAENIHLEDFTLEECRRHGVFAINMKGIKLYKLEIRNTGNIAVNIIGDSRNCQISQCYVHDTCGGLWMNGGNRTILESSGNVIQHNEVTRFDRLGAAGLEGIHANGDGFIIKNNHVYDGQGRAVVFLGNDINIRNNLIHHVCKNMSNCQALISYNDVSFRGNIIQTNIVHDVYKFIPGGANKAIHLDNLISGVKIVNNVFYNNGIHVTIGGGQYNEIKNNVMYNAKYGSISVDTRGMNTNLSRMLDERLHAMPYNASLWSLRYPHLADIDPVHDGYPPIGNQIIKNMIYAAPHTYIIRGIPSQLQANASAYFNLSQTGFSSGSGDHVDVSQRDLRVICRARTWASIIGFHQAITPNYVGPSYPVGPTYLNRGRVHLVNTTVPSNCTTKPPPTEQPVPSYIPDGSNGNEVFHRVDKTGCWLNVTKCAKHPTTIGAYRDMYGERYRNASANESMCFRRALEHWQLCGSNLNDPVLVTYGPTGNSTLGGDSCFASWYGCPKHGGKPEDGFTAVKQHRNGPDGFR